MCVWVHDNGLWEASVFHFPKGFHINWILGSGNEIMRPVSPSLYTVSSFLSISFTTTTYSFYTHQSKSPPCLFICPLNAKFTSLFGLTSNMRLAYPNLLKFSTQFIFIIFWFVPLSIYACSFQFTVMDHHHIHMYNHSQMVLISRMDVNGVHSPIVLSCLAAKKKRVFVYRCSHSSALVSFRSFYFSFFFLAPSI